MINLESFNRLPEDYKAVVNHIVEAVLGDRIINLKSFNRLPEDYKAVINRIVEDVLGDESPDMNDAFRVWQAEVFDVSALPEDKRPGLLELEALAFRGSWESRGQASGAPL